MVQGQAVGSVAGPLVVGVGAWVVVGGKEGYWAVEQPLLAVGVGGWVVVGGEEAVWAAARHENAGCVFLSRLLPQHPSTPRM